MGDGPTVAEVGEFALIDRIVAALPGGKPGQVVVGPGDDAAVVKASRSPAVISTDMLVEGRHFRRDWSAPADVGARAAAASLVDIAAMGARTTTLVVALGIPADLPADWVDGLYQGLCEAAVAEGAAVVGGDVVRSDRIVVSVTAVGDMAGRSPVLRSGAKPGDEVAVGGRLGWASAGLSILSRGFRTPRALVDSYRRPELNCELARSAASAGATAMIDVSDGLIADLRHVARASRVAISLDSKLVPVSEHVAAAAAAFNADPLVWVLTGGDDHAIAATFPAGSAPEGFVVVGEVLDLEDSDVLQEPGVSVDGRVPRGTGGHDHFAG